MSGLSFGFSKKIEQKVLQTAAINDTEKEDVLNPDYLTSYDEATSKLKQKKEEIVIPLIRSNQWRCPKRPQDFDEDDSAPTKKPKNAATVLMEGDDAKAAKELLEDAERLNDEWEGRDGTNMPDMTIPILMRNKVPDGFETDDKLDVSLRPDNPTEADYDRVPIEAFGKAILRGMGWKEGTGLGKDGKLVAPVNAVLRPKGMGLGADRSLVQNLNKNKKSKNKDEEELEMKNGAYCVVTAGKHADYYGVVEGLDEDNARAFVKLTLTGEKISISQLKLKLVSSEDYKKNSKYINKSKADEYHKETEKRLMEKYEKEADRKHKSRDEDRERRKHKEYDSHSSKNRENGHSSKHSKHRDRDSEHSSKHKHKHTHKHSDKHSGSSRSPVWLRPHLRVRIIDESYKKGKYYKEKVVVEDVISGYDCICKTAEGKLLEGLSQNMLETVVPKNVPAIVMVVSGVHRTKLGELVSKDKSTYMATVQVLPDRDEILQLNFDSICDYTGDTHTDLDY